MEAARAVVTGEGDLFVAGGVESMSRAPLAMAKGDRPFARGDQTVYDTALGWRFPNPRMAEMFPLEQMGETAENVAERYGVAREDQDAFALRSQRRWAAADSAGRFADELVALDTLVRDEHPRPDTSIEALSALRAVFRKGGTVTAGNSSGLADGAAALVIASEERAQVLGLEPLGAYVTSAAVGVDPRVMGIGPVGAVRMVLARAGLGLGEIDLVELNEAFASQAIAVSRELGLDEESLNVNGGAIAIGHPLGMSGARLVVALLHELGQKARPPRPRDPVCRRRAGTSRTLRSFLILVCACGGTAVNGRRSQPQHPGSARADYPLDPGLQLTERRDAVDPVAPGFVPLDVTVVLAPVCLRLGRQPVDVTDPVAEAAQDLVAGVAPPGCGRRRGPRARYRVSARPSRPVRRPEKRSGSHFDRQRRPRPGSLAAVPRARPAD